MPDLPESLSGLTAAELSTLHSNLLTEMASFTALPVADITVEQVNAASVLEGQIDQVEAELAARVAASEKAAALQTRFSAPVEPEPVVEPEAEPEPVVEPEAEPESDPAPGADPSESPGDPAPADAGGQASGGVDTAALGGRRPALPAKRTTRPKITAAQDVPGVPTGSELTPATLATAVLDKMSRFPAPNGRSETFASDMSQMHFYDVAQIKKDFPDDLRITHEMGPQQIQEVFDRATDISRLPGGNLTAAAAWCSPSPISYNIDANETEEGLLSVPEVGMPRGGIKRTLGPDWAEIFAAANFFKMTEATAIAGTFTKPCMSITCPTFDDIRLDAVGLCIQAPFLTEAAYPELVRRWISGAMTAYAHKINSDKIGRLVTEIGAAEVANDATSTVGSLFGAIQFFIDRERAKRKLSMRTPMEVVLPHWVPGALKQDLSLRMGQDFLTISDAQIASLFAAVNAKPQYVYDWQEIATTATGWPVTFDMLIYKAGTFVFGTTDVVNLQNVYDAASLKANVYTALFAEEGLALARMGYGGIRVTVPVCSSGHTGSANIAQCFTDATP